jgi:hypothetical protein
MSVPNIKMHLVPDSVYFPNWSVSYPDIRASIGGAYNQAKLIERAIDEKKIGTQPGWGTLFLPEYMIKLKPISSGSNVYEIDIGPGSGFYHNTLTSNFFCGCNFANENGSSFTIQKWLFNRKDFGKLPRVLNSSVLYKKQVQIKTLEKILAIQPNEKYNTNYICDEIVSIVDSKNLRIF